MSTSRDLSQPQAPVLTAKFLAQAAAPYRSWEGRVLPSIKITGKWDFSVRFLCCCLGACEDETSPCPSMATWTGDIGGTGGC